MHRINMKSNDNKIHFNFARLAEKFCLELAKLPGETLLHQDLSCQLLII
jgi:hypothetical protein